MMVSGQGVIFALVPAFVLSTTLICTITAQKPQLHRCTHKFEHFRDGHLRQPRSVAREGNHPLQHNYNGTDNEGHYNINNDGYYVVHGVKVLPSEDPACSGIDHIRMEENIASDLATQNIFEDILTLKPDLGHLASTEKVKSKDAAKLEQEQQRVLLRMISYESPGQKKVNHNSFRFDKQLLSYSHYLN
jgi:hypothetical protein